MSLGPPDCPNADTQSDRGTEVSWNNDSAILHYHQREDDSDFNDDCVPDDAILHFNPGDPPPRQPLPPSQAVIAVDIPSTTPNLVVSAPQIPAEQLEGRKTVKPRSRKKRANAQPNEPTRLAEADDAELKSKMLDAIRGDDELYHRILRYDVRFLRSFCASEIVALIELTMQPIPLGDFVALATRLDFPIRGLQTKVAKLLDEQASRYSSGKSISTPHLARSGSTLPDSCERKPSLKSASISVFLWIFRGRANCILLASPLSLLVYSVAHKR